MKTVQEFKKLLRLNKLVIFEELYFESQQFLDQMGYTTEYQNLIKKQELPSKIVIKHYKKSSSIFKYNFSKGKLF